MKILYVTDMYLISRTCTSENSVKSITKFQLYGKWMKLNKSV